MRVLCVSMVRSSKFSNFCLCVSLASLFFPRNNYCTCPSYRQIDVSPFRTPTVLTAHRYRGSPLADWFHTWSYFPLLKKFSADRREKGGNPMLYICFYRGRKEERRFCVCQRRRGRAFRSWWMVHLLPLFSLLTLKREQRGRRRRTPSYPLTCSVFQWTDSLNRKRKKKIQQLRLVKCKKKSKLATLLQHM